MGIRLFCLLLVLLPIVAQAQGTKLWNQSSYENFEKGTPHGVAIRSDGALEPSPVAAVVATTPASYIWSMAAGKRGSVYLGTGSPAMVLKVAPNGTVSKLLETKELSVQVVRMGPDGMLYAATLPNGKVYRIDPNGPDTKIDSAPQPVYKQSPPKTDRDQSSARPSSGNATVVFDPAKLNPKPTYIWDMAFDSTGRLYIATGDPAAIYRVDMKNPAAPPEKFFSSSEQHIRCLMFSKDGTLYAGSDGRGLVYRIPPDGKGFVLFEAPAQEISALALDPQNNLYVAALGEKGASALPPLMVHSTPTLTATIRIVTAGSTATTDSTLVPNGTSIYQIAPDGSPRQLWSSKHDVVYALAWRQSNANGESGLLVGSGNLGHLYRIASDGTYADLAHLEARQATAFASIGNDIYVATSNIGKLYKFATAGDKGGGASYISQIKDAGFFSQWGRAQMRGTGDYDLFARVGNIEQPTEGWSDWQKVTPGSTSAVLPKARFLQWKAVLHPGAELRAVGFYYLPQNIAPVVDDIVVKLHARVVAGLNPAAQYAPVPIDFPAHSTDGVTYLTEQTSTPLMAMPAAHWATARWKAHDPNGDKLSYSVYYRGDGESNWQLLQSNIRDDYASFDLTRIPDGGYTLRIVASDAPSQPAGRALTGYKDSGHFLLDTTPPMLTPLQAVLHGNSIHVVFDAQTKFSTVERAYYSVDAGPWQYVEPEGQLSDSLHEHYDFTATLPKPDAQADRPAGVALNAPQQHVIAVRVLDRAGNATTAKAIVQ